MMRREQRPIISMVTSSRSCNSLPLMEPEAEEVQRAPPPPQMKRKKCLSKQLSMCETSRDSAWERRRRQNLYQEQRKGGSMEAERLTDDDLRELKGCIELGFGFNEEAGRSLGDTLPALDLYLAVNRQVSPTAVSTPQSSRESSYACLADLPSAMDSPKSESEWKICSPGYDPGRVKLKLRHWAQLVACSVLQLS